MQEVTQAKGRSEVFGPRWVLWSYRGTGITPLLPRRYSPETQKVPDDASVHLRAERFVYRRASDGRLVIPRKNLSYAISDAGKRVKYGAKQVSTERESRMGGHVFLVSPSMDIIHPATGEPITEYDTIQGWAVNSQDKKIVDAFPIIHEWAFETKIMINVKGFRPDVLRMVLDTAGMCIGMMTLRPTRKGYYGIWRTDVWEKEKGEGLEFEEAIDIIRTSGVDDDYADVDWESEPKVLRGKKAKKLDMGD